MNRTDSILYDALIDKGILTKEALSPLVLEAQGAAQALAALLIGRNIVNENDILNIYAEQLKLERVDLKNISVDKSVLNKIPVKIASYYRFMPLAIKERLLTVAVYLPLDIKTKDEIRMQLGYDIEMALAPFNDVMDALKKHYGLAAEILGGIVAQAPIGASGDLLKSAEDAIEDIEKLAGDASVIKLVNQIILEGWRKRATDIHIEPYRQGVTLRYRIDGILYDANVPGDMKNFLSAIISRIKIMSNLNIVERRLPQDGRAVVKVGDQVLDLRISTIPTPFGESVVIRILPTQLLYNLEKLGLAKKDLDVFEALVEKPHGIIFITGPTGSGKTTSLYACLGRINKRDRKIITIEDPIEYEVPGITQIQVQPEIGLDFARGLRSILRHDPDVIMVGEVRDLETAEIAIRVALTGHLVFSTLHTNDAASGITRLLDIGLEPYLVASSVEAFIAQRLVRLICPHCKHEDKKAPEELKALIAKDLGFKSTEEVRIFRGKGCAACNFTGFFGRSAIYEILLVDESIKDLILNKSQSGQIKRTALVKGMRTLRQDGWQKTIAGMTTAEEVMRVTSAEERESEGGKNAPNRAYEGAFQHPASGLLESERRIYNRLNSSVSLHYKVFKSRDELLKRMPAAEKITSTENISAGGLLFSSSELLAVSSFLELNVELPDNEGAIDCLARIVRVEEAHQQGIYNIAVCFLDITSAQRSRLERYVESGGK